MESGYREYKNDDITVYWRPDKCIHATTCYKELIDVFNPRKRPWVNMKGAPTERIIEIVNKCPTEALTYKWLDDEKNERLGYKKLNTSPEDGNKGSAASEPVKINVMKDGPLVVQGQFKVYDSRGRELRSMRMMSFCRCGHSNAMPFCDGFHRKVDFQSEV